MGLFVYGSLLRGERHHDVLAAARFLGPARTAARYRLVQGEAYPALLTAGQATVIGELYEVSAELLVRLDAFEDHPNLYRRTSILLADGTEAWAYVGPADAEDWPEI